MPTDIQQLASRVRQKSGPHTRGSPSTTGQTSPTDRPQQSFQKALDKVQETKGRKLKLSAHAQERIAQRAIAFDADTRRSIEQAMGQLAGKGARDALLLRSDAAFLVNVPNQTMVTAMNQSEMQERVFTNIDSAYLLTD